MLSTLRNAWKVPELRTKLYWTIALLAIFRMGSHIPVPGLSTEYLKSITEGNTLLGFYDLISGGALSQASIFALGVMPYINASIIMQLLTIAIPSLEQLSKEGDDGRKKIQKATRYLALVIAIILAIGFYVTLASKGGATGLNTMQVIVVVFTFVVGSTFCIWLGDQITVKGIGNGTSLMIFVNIVSRLPMQVYSVLQLKEAKEVTIVEISLLIVALAVLFGSVIFFSLAERRIPVQYAGKAAGNKIVKGQSTHIPLSIIGSCVIAIIFSMSVMEFPKTIAQFAPDAGWAQWITNSPYSIFNEKQWMYPIVYALLTLFFTWFYTQVTFKPEEMAENLNKSAGFVPGVRPGEATAQYLEKLLTKISIISGLFAAVIAITPVIIDSYTKFQNMAFGSTSLLIMVGVALDFSRQIESQLVMRHYQGFLK
ncbi:MAG: preprotein translocase subunit SecY [Clostridium sp.]